MANIISKYTVTVFDDGQITVDKVWMSDSKKDNRQLDLDKCGSRITQILSVINYAYHNTGTIEQRIQKAMSDTAGKYGISVSSCFDKCTRQISLSIAEFRNEVNKLFEANKNDAFKDILLNKLGLSTYDHDKRAVEELFSIIENSKKEIE